MTPEGKIKKEVKAILDAYPDLYYFMPVLTGYGQRTLDFIICYRAMFVGIETKAPGKKPTPRQRLIIDRMLFAEATVFLIDGPDGLLRLRRWLEDEAGEESNRSVPPIGTT